MHPPDRAHPPDRTPTGLGRLPRPWLIILVIGLVAAGFLLGRRVYTEPAPRAVTYSEFKTRLRAGGLADVVVTPDAVSAQLRDGTGMRVRALRIEDPGLLADLEAQKVSYRAEQRPRWLTEVADWIFPLALLALLWFFVLRRFGGAEGGLMSFGRSRAKIYAEDHLKVSFADVAGVDEAAGELREIVEFLRTPSKYTNLGGRIPKGVLLVGPPGTGKTLLARAVAGEAGVPFFSLSGSEFVEMFVGVGAARVRDLFTRALHKAPCIVFIDELDALGKVRNQSPGGGHEEREQTLNQLLSEMDGFDPRKAVIIMAATNRPEVLDPALLRPGRFDRQVLVDKPDIRGREAILRIHVREVRLATDVDLAVIAARTAGFAGADLANLVNEAALLAARRDKPHVDRRDFEEAVDRVIAGLEKRRVMSDRERRIVAYHESGHAIVAASRPNLDPVHKISIVQRGFGALGFTMQLPTEDRYLQTEADLHSQLAVLLGGRMAEAIALGEVSTGAAHDLMRATDIARAMVTELGMSAALGLVSYNGHERRGRFIEGQAPPERGQFSERTAEQIDAEIRRILDEAQAEAERILTERRAALEAVTGALLEREVLDAEEFHAILRETTGEGLHLRHPADVEGMAPTGVLPAHTLRGGSPGAA
jgi:cell division protease FtsH